MINAFFEKIHFRIVHPVIGILGSIRTGSGSRWDICFVVSPYLRVACFQYVPSIASLCHCIQIDNSEKSQYKTNIKIIKILLHTRDFNASFLEKIPYNTQPWFFFQCGIFEYPGLFLKNYRMAFHQSDQNNIQIFHNKKLLKEQFT